MSELDQATLVDLLDEWAELEPDRCFRHDNEYGEWFSVLNGDQTDSPVCTRHGIEGPSGLESEGLALIQSAVQEAIEEREWDWTMGSVVTGGGESHMAKVQSSEDRSVSIGSSPAHAILSAYIKALKDHE